MLTCVSHWILVDIEKMEFIFQQDELMQQVCNFSVEEQLTSLLTLTSQGCAAQLETHFRDIQHKMLFHSNLDEAQGGGVTHVALSTGFGP